MRSSRVLIGSLLLALSLAGCSAAAKPLRKAAPTTTSTVAPVEACANDQIQVKYGRGLAGQGDEGAVIIFTNVSPITCTMTGYPVVIAVDGANNQTPLQETINGALGGVPQGQATYPVIRLTQDNSASAAIESKGHPGENCPRYSTLLVGLPGGSPIFQLPATLPDLGLNLPACDPPPQVHPLFPGFEGL